MAKWVLATAMTVVLALTVGCSSGGSGGAENSGVTYESMVMDANAEAALTAMPEYVDEYVAYAEEDAEVEGDDYLDVRGVDPIFVGYEVIAWEPIQGSEDVEYIEVSYINGHIASGYAAPENEMSHEPEVYEFHALGTRGMPALPSTGELDAVAAAEAKLAEFFDDLSTSEWGIKRYLFLYEKDGQGVVMGMTADGELGSYSEPVELAQ